MSCGRAGADLHPAAVLAQRLDAALRPGAHPLLDDRGGGVDDDAAGHLHLHLAGLAGDVRRDVLGRQLPGRGTGGPTERVSLIRSTRKVRQSSRSRSNATRYQRCAPVDQPVGLDPALGGRAGVVGVGEPDHLAVPGAAATSGQQLPATSVPRRRAGHPARCGPAARRPARRAVSAAPAAAWSAPAARSPLCPSTAPPLAVPSATAIATASSSSSSSGGIAAPARQPVAADGAARGEHRVAELAQPVDVVAHRALGDPEPVGELGTGPLARGLQQGQQLEEASGGLCHVLENSPASGTKRA